MMRPVKQTLLTGAALLLLSTVASAIFTNGGFETGDFSGWTKSWFLNPGLAGAQPYTGASIVRNAGGFDRTAVLTAAGPMAASDPIVTAALYPRFGTRAARVNFHPLGSNPDANANSLLQTATVVAGDVDPDDSLVHLRFAYLPILENPNHPPNEQPWFYIAVRNLTRATTVWQRFAFANEPGVPWQIANAGGVAYTYTGWQLVDVPGGAGVIEVGDSVQLEVVAAACSLGGHRGHVYVDAFGSTIPGGTVVATAPASVNAGAPLTYAFHVNNGGAGTLQNTVVSIAIPAQTTFASVSDAACSHAGGVVTCSFGDLAAAADRDFTLTVNTAPTAAGTIMLGNYTIAGTGYPALLGPARTTAVINTAPVGVADSYWSPRMAA